MRHPLISLVVITAFVTLVSCNKEDPQAAARYEQQETELARLKDEVVLLREEKEKTSRQLQGWSKAIQDQEARVAERRKNVSAIARARQILQQEGARGPMEEVDRLKQDKMWLETQINNLLQYQADGLFAYAADVDLPDNVIRNLYPQYLELKRQIESLKVNSLGPNHPTVKAISENVANLEKDLEQGVVNLKSTLQNQLALVLERLKSAELKQGEDIEKSIIQSMDAQDYVEAKKDFETELAVLRKLKEIAEETGTTPQASDSTPSIKQDPENIAK